MIDDPPALSTRRNQEPVLPPYSKYKISCGVVTCRSDWDSENKHAQECDEVLAIAEVSIVEGVLLRFQPLLWVTYLT